MSLCHFNFNFNVIFNFVFDVVVNSNRTRMFFTSIRGRLESSLVNSGFTFVTSRPRRSS
jgi:hypothetical protein